MDKTARRKIGLRIREIRKQRGLTQEELGEKSGLTAKFIGALERGEHFASFSKTEEIAKALNCDFRHFFEIDYLDESARELASIAKGKLSLLSKSDLRIVLKVIDGLTNK